MPKHHLGLLSSDHADGNAFQDDTPERDATRSDARQVSAYDSGSLAAADRDQLEREFAAIERASAALRRAEPGLQSWTSPPAAMLHKPRPVWLLIGILWLSTALVTLGAVFAISALVG
jgi:hypothetical protein